MSCFPDLSSRSHELELMDIPDSDTQKLHRTLEQFRLINRLLTPCRRLFKNYFAREMRLDRQRSWTLLDLGAGGCDMALWFAAHCGRLGIDVRITCLDNDGRVVQFARSKCRDVANIEIVESDVLQLNSDHQWDFVFANHFLHHLNDSQVVSALRLIDELARVRFVLSDIRRSYSVYAAYTAFAAICLRNSFAFYDGRLSVRKGFTECECASLIDQGGLSGRAFTQRCFPGHLVIASPLKGSNVHALRRSV